jgi:hypothetical protein
VSQISVSLEWILELVTGTLSPTTPLIPVKRKLARITGATNRPRSSSRPIPGVPQGKHSKSEATTSKHFGVEELNVIDDHEDAEDVEDIQPATARKHSGRSDVTTLNGKREVKGKGKAKADPSKPTSKAVSTSELVNVDDVQIIEIEDVERDTRAMDAVKNKRTNTALRPAQNNSAAKELERLRRKAIDVS